MDQSIEREQQDDVSGMTLSQVIHSLGRWFRYLLPKWWIFLLAGAGAGAAGFFYAGSKKPQYEARITFALEDNGGGMGGAFSLASELGFNLGGGKDVFAGDNIIAILTSRKMVERVLLANDTVNGKPVTFAEEIINFSDLRKTALKDARFATVTFPPAYPREKFSYLQDSVLFILYRGIVEGSLAAGRPDKKLNIYEVTLVSSNERLSKVFIEKLLKETTAFYTELRSKRSRETLEILEQRVGALRGSLNSAISSKASTQDANLNPAFSAAQAPLQKKQVDITVYGSAYGELYKNLEMARYQYLKDMPLLQVIDEPNYPMKRIKMSRLYTAIIFAFFTGILVLVFLVLRRYLKMNDKTEKQKTYE
ncbi:MAG: hypothetical protein V4722_04740 [Bacteroidota bacterium]